MQNQNQQPSFFVPTALVPQQSGPQAPFLCNEAPARVKVAIEFLMNLSFKTCARGIANDIAIEVIPGQSLTVDEMRTQAAACEMLYDYFHGAMKGSEWEKKFLDRTQPSMDDECAIIQCPKCRGSKSGQDCPICCGTGAIVTRPYRRET